MRAYKSAVFALVAFTLAALPVGAQDAKPVEVTPYVALGTAAASPVGASLPVTTLTRRSLESRHRDRQYADADQRAQHGCPPHESSFEIGEVR